MDLAIIGSGYVGLVTGACFADVGHNVICVDNDLQKIELLQGGRVPIYEPGLEEVIHRNVSAHRLRFTSSIREGVENSQIIFIAVPTPQQPNGDVDLSFLEKVAREIAGVLSDYRVIVDKSTVPVKTGEKVAESIKRYNQHSAKFDVVSNPEFLREGCAVADLMHPDRIVIGAQSEHAIDLMKKVYEPFMAPILVTDINSAELIKHCANSFLALKISYVNAVSAICEVSGARVVAYDPKGLEKARGVKAIDAAEFAPSALDAVTDAEALIIATEWDEFANVDLAVVKEKMRTPILFDGRNLLDPETMRRLGFHYHSIGRARVKPQ